MTITTSNAREGKKGTVAWQYLALQADDCVCVCVYMRACGYGKRRASAGGHRSPGTESWKLGRLNT